MKFFRPTLMRLAGAFALAAACVSAAQADSRYRERVHADSFGNLVVYAPGGYKRIVVDKGYLAEELAAYGRAEAPVGDEGDAPQRFYERGRYDDYGYDDVPCRRLPARVQGRSYMYGLPENVVPIISACE